MSELWTKQRVLDLAPDAASVKAGQGQAQLKKWVTLGRSEQALWGEVQGSGKKPYQTQVDLDEPAFKCSCPSRKFPCKHALGLMLVLAEHAIADAETPDWVADWFASRTKRAEQREARAQAKGPVDAAAQAKRAAKREDKVQAGIAELSQFLADLMRQGLATAQTWPAGHWQQMAARMVDAQAPGLARLVRALGEAVSSGGDWQSRFLTVVGRLHLATCAYGRLESLPPEVQSDLRALVGWTVSQDELLNLTPETGRWLVLGKQVEEEDRLKVQRTWLARRDDGRPALILDFSAANQPLDVSLMVGTEIEATLVYYPGACPLRAMIKDRQGAPESISELPSRTIDEALGDYADALARNPWLERWPVTLGAVFPVTSGSHWSIQDRSNVRLAVVGRFGAGWHLLSVSGGHPVTLFGTWDGEALLPLGLWSPAGYFSISTSRAPLARVS